ncbi:hypothetical protein BDV97DRAFT_361339 [Delphinella strobiligena]|nr:hypothetical protein BDV97DRAFT_361339 [Delphinella strobiligena]
MSISSLGIIDFQGSIASVNKTPRRLRLLLFPPTHLTSAWSFSTMAKRKAKAVAHRKAPKRPKSTSTDTNPSPKTTRVPRNRKEVHVQAQSPLLSLPPELRTIIFQLALTKEPHTTLMENHHDNSQDAEPSLIRTCRLARLEGLPVFYGHNDWVVKGRWEGSRVQTVRGSGCVFYSKWLDEVDGKKIAMMQTIILVRCDRDIINTVAIPPMLPSWPFINGAWKLHYFSWLHRKPSYRIDFVNLDGSSDTQREETQDAQGRTCGICSKWHGWVNHDFRSPVRSR